MGSFLSGLNGVIGGVSGLMGLGGLVSGLFGESDAEKQQQQAIQALQANNAQQLQNLANNNQLTTLQQAGSGGDAIRNLGSSLGSAFAHAGLYNSSAVGGALANAAGAQQASLADLAAKNQYNMQNLQNQQADQIAQMQYGLGAQNLGIARQNVGGAASGLQSYLQSLTQQSLGQTGANAYRAAAPGAGGNGTGGSWFNGLPGNSGNFMTTPLTTGLPNMMSGNPTLAGSSYLSGNMR